MARELANIRLDIWTSQEFRDLTEAEQRLYFLLLSHDSLSYAGVADWRPRRLARFAASSTPESIEQIGLALQAKRFILIDDDSEEVLIRSFLKHDGLLKQPRLTVSMVNAYGSTTSENIRSVIIHELQKLMDAGHDWAGLKHERVRNLLKERSAPIEDFISPKPCPPFHPNVGQGLGLHTSTTTATSLSKDSDWSPDGDRFKDFWELWPRKVKKPEALKAFSRALRRTDAETIIAGAERFANDPNLPEPQFIPHPATWLNNDQWNDGPLPPRTTGQPRQSAADRAMQRGAERHQQIENGQLGHAISWDDVFTQTQIER